MAKKPNKMGAPRKEVDFHLVDILCGLQCTGEEIARKCGVSYPTLLARIRELDNPDGKKYKTFLEYFSASSSEGKTSLRQMQFAAAKKGSVPMLIHLGKNILGQTDKHDITTDGKKTIHVRFTENED